MAKVDSSAIIDNVDLRIAKSAKTRSSVIAAATELFLSDGYSSTSLDKVASAAGVTKPTVYSHFKSKEGLLEAVIQNFSSRPLKEISDFLQPSDDPRSDLTKFGNFFMARVFEKETIRFRRLAITESAAYPEVGAAFFAAGPGRLLAKLAKYFEMQTKAGRLNISNSANCAEQFIGMLIGLDLLRSETGQALPSTAKRKQRCRNAVELFMATYGA